MDRDTAEAHLLRIQQEVYALEDDYDFPGATIREKQALWNLGYALRKAIKEVQDVQEETYLIP